MSCASATGSENRPRAGRAAWGLAAGLRRSVAGAAWVLAAAALVGCSSAKPAAPSGKVILIAKEGESAIQVTESEINGSQVVRIDSRYKGEDHSVVIQLDADVYDLELPLTLEQIAPKSVEAAARSPEVQFQDLLIAQWLEEAQEAMLAGNYAKALRQVNLVLLTRPDHVQAHAMKGSIYYAMGDYPLADQEWQRVLAIDPKNPEVRAFTEFLKNHQAGAQPPLPGAPGPAAPAGAPAPPRRTSP